MTIKKKQVEENIEKDKEKLIKLEFKHTNSIAFKALQKELSIEEMIKKEELKRELNEEKKILQTIEIERKKSECIIKAIQEKDLENKFNIK